MSAEPLQTLLDSQEVATDSTLDKIQPTTELKLDLWGLRQGESLLQESLKLQRLALNKEEVADLHGLAFLPSLEFHAQSQDPIRRQFMEQLLQSIEFQLLKDSTRLNLIASQIAATAFGSELHHLKIKLLGNTATKDGGGGIIPCITSTAKAAKAASKEVGDFTQVYEIFGLGEGKPGEVVDATELKLLFERFQANPTLRQISRLAGSYRKVAEGIHRTQTRDGFDDFAGVILGNELSRILPMELLRIALPEL
ncbi:MAG: hypothetical protein ACO3GX_14535, partial [Gemmataceae bacterium]